MKLTKSKLKQIIKEELSRLNENPEKMQALADKLGGEVSVDNYGQFLISVDVNNPPDPSHIPPEMNYEDGVIYTDYYFGEGEEDEDPRSSLGGMIDVDYEDPITAPRSRGLEETLPPHLQSKVDAYEKKKQKFSITDVTPPGYGPDEPEEEDEPLRLRSPSKYGTGEDPLKRDPPSALRRKSLRKERNERRRKDRSNHLEE